KSIPPPKSMPLENPAMFRRLPTWFMWRLDQSSEPRSTDGFPGPSKSTSWPNVVPGDETTLPSAFQSTGDETLAPSTRAIGTQPAGSGSGNFAPVQNFLDAGVPSRNGSEPGTTGANHDTRYRGFLPCGPIFPSFKSCSLSVASISCE